MRGENLEAARASSLEARVAAIEGRLEAGYDGRESSVSIVCFSGDWDRLFAALTIANGALALGQEVHLFFTFWAASALRDEAKTPAGRSFVDRLMKQCLPAGARRAPLSRMHWGGLGKVFIGWRMRKENIEGIDTLLERAREAGARFHLCETSASLLGLDCGELVGDGEIDPCGVTTFLGKALKGRMVLFI